MMFSNVPQQQMFHSDGFMGQQPMTGNMSAPVRFRRFDKPPIDKSNSRCNVCHAIGHWSGDAVCPMNGFPRQNRNVQMAPNMPGAAQNAAPAFQPPPPGTTG